MNTKKVTFKFRIGNHTRKSKLNDVSFLKASDFVTTAHTIQLRGIHYRGILFYNISARHSVSDGAANKSVMNIERS